MPAIELQLRLDGYPIVVLCSIFAIPGPAGDQQFVCLDIDITRRKRAADSVQASKQELNSFSTHLRCRCRSATWIVAHVSPGERRLGTPVRAQAGRRSGKTGLDIVCTQTRLTAETFFGAFAQQQTFDDAECWFKSMPTAHRSCVGFQHVSSRVSGQRLMVAASGTSPP